MATATATPIKSKFVKKSIPDQVADVLVLPPLGKCIDELNQIREAKRAAQASLDVIDEEYHKLEATLMERLEKDGMAKATGSKATISISYTVVGNVTDWHLAETYIHKHKYLHLFQRRLNDAGLRELFDAGKTIPGVEPFTKKRLNLRAI